MTGRERNNRTEGKKRRIGNRGEGAKGGSGREVAVREKGREGRQRWEDGERGRGMEEALETKEVGAGMCWG